MESNSKSTMPCAACKHLRRRCTEDCLFLPYFPAAEPEKFMAVHRVFGASNISKMLQDVPVTDRGDAAASLVYEATARLQQPVYGCVALIASLQKRVFQLQSELDEVSATTMRLRTQLSSALSFIVSSPQSPPLACAAEEGSSHEHNKQLQQCQYGYSYPQMKDYYTEL
ncbi:LOB domain-containing protein 4-like [Salvia miltiorrhiza]|uniref:LOB domain-containing protein 4-like n=1 Tax=Salvia miltiorrhiza TaxID=226208 RepID=UPI0025AD2FB3|nr:LOB domain-containing protein 4-like [Salvia miltiorrhiza]